MKLYDRILPPRVLELPNGKQILKYRSRAPLWVLAVVLLTALSVKVTGFDMGILAARIREFFVILGEMLPPDWGYLSQVWQPLFDTIKMSLLGSAIGSLLVVPFAMLASTNIIRSRLVVSAVRLLLSIIRTLPHAGDGPDCHVHFRPGHTGRNDSHRHFYLCLYRENPLRGNRDGGYGSL